MNAYGAITDVPGVLVGHAERVGEGWLSGVTVVRPPAATVGAVDVRGGGPGTHETDALAPGRLIQHPDAVVLTGGSAPGLVSAYGVQRWCEEHGHGFAVGNDLRVPIVPAAALFDLGRGGDPSARPDSELGYAAAAAARDGAVPTGTIGAGTGAVLAQGTLKGGVGTASIRLDGGVVVGALAAANAFGSPYDPGFGSLYAAAFVGEAELRPRVPDPAELAAAAAAGTPPEVNTTLVVVATNARLDRSQASRLAGCGHDGLARALRPVHTLVDGDTVFALATGDVEASGASPTGWPGAADVGGTMVVQAAAADAVTLAVLDAVLSATAVQTPVLQVPAYLDRFPSARPPAWRS